jgi:hypothetical protein
MSLYKEEEEEEYNTTRIGGERETRLERGSYGVKVNNVLLDTSIKKRYDKFEWTFVRKCFVVV